LCDFLPLCSSSWGVTVGRDRFSAGSVSWSSVLTGACTFFCRRLGGRALRLFVSAFTLSVPCLFVSLLRMFADDAVWSLFSSMILLGTRVTSLSFVCLHPFGPFGCYVAMGAPSAISPPPRLPVWLIAAERIRATSCREIFLIPSIFKICLFRIHLRFLLSPLEIPFLTGVRGFG